MTRPHHARARAREEKGEKKKGKGKKWWTLLIEYGIEYGWGAGEIDIEIKISAD
jgi:hypothetical protein